MAKFLIQGGKNLKGEITVSGSKNAALPILAATILTDRIVTLKNVPKISDVEIMLEILSYLGATIKKQGNTIKISCQNIQPKKLPTPLVGIMRASVLLIGPFLARFGKIEIPTPGGCLIGVRSIVTHLRAFSHLGAKIKEKDNYYLIEAPKLNLKTLILDEMSVTATENILMATAFGNNDGEIRLAACEPEVVALGEFLNKLGASFQGLSTSFIKVNKGRLKNKDIEFEIIPDRIEAATFMILGAISQSPIIVKGIIPHHLDAFLNIFRKAGVNFQIKENQAIFPSFQEKFQPVNIRTDVYPGFATDYAPPFSILLTQCFGKSIIFETLFEGRLNYLGELSKMGAEVKILSPHLAEIKGPVNLRASSTISLDLRAGATLILASLIANGTSEIKEAEIIDRGYEKIDEKLQKIGAEIKRLK